MEQDREQALPNAHPLQDPPDFDVPPIEAYAHDVQATGEDTDTDDSTAANDHPYEQGSNEGLDDELERKRAQAREDLFARLNSAQREAVFADASSSLVLAAAGSGKTSVLTARIARLITNGAGHGAVPPSAVLAVTFTNKAAQEMRNRLQALLDRQTVHKIWVGTFHSLCARLLRENAVRAGLPKTFAILDVDAQEAMCRGILKDMGLTRSAARDARRQREATRQGGLDLVEDTTLSTPGADLAGRLLEAGAIVGDDLDGETSPDLATPAQCARYIGSRKEAQQPPRPPRDGVSRRSSQIDQLEAVYAEYEARCRRSGLLDFADLLGRAVLLLQTDAEVRTSIQERFSAILVDEFQDTNDLQYRWLGLITGPAAHVMAVGDDDQSIYAFRGAKPENMQRFLREFASSPQHPQGRLIRLEHNYRSLPHILEAANAVISRNSNRLGKILRTTQPGRGERIALCSYDSGPQEAASVAESIHKLVRQGGVPPAEIAVLYRANHQSRLLEAELNKRGLPLTVYGGFRFYERQEVKYALAYLDLVCDATHDLSFAKVANFPPRGLGETTIEELRQDAQLRRISMMEMVATRQQWRKDSPAQIGNASAIKRQLVMERLADLVMGLAEAASTMQLHELLERTLTESGLMAHYEKESAEDSPEGSERLANLAELISAARQFIVDNPQLEQLDTLGQLGEYLAHVALMTSTSESDMSTKNTVSLMTVHSAKGLEFDHVFVTGLEEGTFPHGRAVEEDAEASAMNARTDDGNGPSTQEERRLMYVALTRARKNLVLSHCEQRMINGQLRHMEPSRFVEELPAAQLHLINATAGATQGRRAPTAIGSHEPQTEERPTAPVAPQPIASAPSRAGQSVFAALAAQHARRPAAPRPMPVAFAARPTLPGLPATGPGACLRQVAIIGTAGRDKARQSQMTPALWEAMLEDVRARVQPDDRLISGGAAWADHLAVELFLEGRVRELTLHLPAPRDDTGRYVGGYGTCGGAANYYHDRFRQVTGCDGLQRISQALAQGAACTVQPAAPGYEAMGRRNQAVAHDAQWVLAYTWDDGPRPAEGGTLQTWEMAQHAQRQHISLLDLTATLQTPSSSTIGMRQRQRAG